MSQPKATTPLLRTPGVYINELNTMSTAITAAPTSVTAFIGRTPSGPTNTPTPILDYAAFLTTFGPPDSAFPLTASVQQFFDAGGAHAVIVRAGSPSQPITDDQRLSALHPLTASAATPFNILVLPPDAPGGDLSPTVLAAAASACTIARAMFLADPPTSWATRAKAGDFTCTPADLGIAAADLANTAVYFPRVLATGPSNPRDSPSAAVTFAPSGLLAGIWATVDRTSGVWRAPANVALPGITGLEITVTDAQQGLLNAANINCLRSFPGRGILVWGARTLSVDSSFLYLNVRRTLLMIEQSVGTNLAWTVFAPNNSSTRNQIVLAVSSFLLTLWQQGALAGSKPEDAFSVRCDASTTTAQDILAGHINLEILVALTRPAEFTIITVQLETTTNS
jgi:phage tail sheath protein FI